LLDSLGQSFCHAWRQHGDVSVCLNFNPGAEENHAGAEHAKRPPRSGFVLVVLYEVTALLRSRGPLAYILILIAETESHIRGLDDVEQGGLSIRMVAGYREAAERKTLLVAEAGFEPATFGL